MHKMISCKISCFEILYIGFGYLPSKISILKQIIMKKDLKPSDVKKAMMASVWRKSEYEMIATNLLKMSKFGNGDTWKPFTWDDYCGYCSHKPSDGERYIIENLANTGYLRKEGDTYHFTDRILEEYARYTD